MAERKASQQSSQQKSATELQPRQSEGIQRRGSTAPARGLDLSLRELLDPFLFMRRIYDDIDRMFMQSGARNGPGSGSTPATIANWFPTIEVSERDGKYVVSAELPGLKDTDVHLVVTDNTLVIEGERSVEREQKEGGIYRTERSYGHFYRAVPLPDGVNPEEAEARFENGVLEVSFPLPAQKSRKEIPIQAGGQQSKRIEGSAQQGAESSNNKADTGKAA